MVDRREKPRLSVSLDAEWDGTTGHHPAKIINMSEGGCYLDTVGEVRRGEIVGFRVLLPDGDWLYLEGEVRHYSAGLGFGVQFIELEYDQKQKIALVIKLAVEAGGKPLPISADLVEE
ncbi:MAG TPA: PilZ domain-containing protein [Pyrinomonadaceae bacterium]|nr:PilZ domain-containing protein [Pyrinomonadaceae bacterium]